MHQPGLVDGFQPGQELERYLARLAELQRAACAQDLGQRRAVDVLHRHQLPAVELLQVEDPADVRRDHLAGAAHLLAQGLQGPLVGQELGPQSLEGHVHAELQVEGPPDLAHAATAELRADAVAVAENLAGRQEASGALHGELRSVALDMRRLAPGLAARDRRPAGGTDTLDPRLLAQHGPAGRAIHRR